MDANVKENVKNIDVWIRGLFIIVFGVILYFLLGIIWLVVASQILTKVFTNEPNSNLEASGANLTNYALQILNYITFQSEERPFPFSPWPANTANRETTTQEIESDKQSKENG